MGEKVHDGKYLLFVGVFYLLLFQSPLTNFFSGFGYSDELIALAAVPFSMFKLKKNEFRIKKRKDGLLIELIVFSTVGILGNLKYNYQPMASVALTDLFLCLKFWLAIYTGKALFTTMDLKKNSHGIFFHVKVMICLFCLLTLVDNVAHIFPANIRYGIRSTHLYYDSPTAFVAACAFLFAVLTIIKPYVDKTQKWFVLLVVLMCSSLRSKAFAAVFAFCTIYYFVFIRKKKITLRTLIIFALVILFMVRGQIEYYFFSDIKADSARYQLLVTALLIAKDSFPLGTGFGTFGSYMSAIHYSPVYRLYGISTVHGLIEGATYFTSDSFWPIILGETGVMGLVSIVIVLGNMLKRLQKIKKINLALYASGLVCMSYMLIISMAESAFVNPIAIPLAIVLGMIYGKGECVEGEVNAENSVFDFKL